MTYDKSMWQNNWTTSLQSIEEWASYLNTNKGLIYIKSMKTNVAFMTSPNTYYGNREQFTTIELLTVT